jgi:two-component system, response regulator YesN
MWHRIFYRYLLSYLAIFLIPFVVFSYLIISVFLQQYRAEVEAEELALVRQTVTIVDTELASVQKIVHSASRNRSFLPEIINLSPYYPIETIQELVMYRDQSSLFFDILYTPHGFERTYGSRSSYATDTIPTKVYLVDGLDQATYSDALQFTSIPSFHGVEEVRYSWGDWLKKDLFVAFYPVPLSISVPYGNFYFLIYPDVLFREINWLIERREGYLLVTDQAGQSVYSTGDRERDSKKGTVEWVVDSDYTGWTFQCFFPEANSFARVKVLETSFAIGAILCVLFSMGMIVVVMNANYKPLVALKRSVEEQLHREIGRARGVDGLHQLIHDLLDKNTTLEEMVLESTSLFKEKLLRGIITSEFGVEEITSISSRIGFELAFARFRVAAVCPHSHHLPDSDWLRISIGHVRRNVAEYPSQIRECLSFSRYLILIIAYDENWLEEEIGLLVAELEADHPTTLACGVGTERGSISDIAGSCREAITALEENIHRRGQPVQLYSDPMERSDWPSSYRKEILENIRGSIKSHNADELSQCMTGLRNEISTSGHSLPVTRHFLVNLIEAVQLIIPGLWNRFRDLPSWEYVYGVVTEEEILDVVDRLHSSIVSLMTEREEDDIVENVSSFVKQQYHDPNLSVEGIANEMSLSYSYLSRSFKQRTGVGLNEFLMRYRIDKFKELAASSDEPIASIIQKIGYRGTYQFGRAFKKREGLPPSEYRKLPLDKRQRNVVANK